MNLKIPPNNIQLEYYLLNHIAHWFVDIKNIKKWLFYTNQKVYEAMKEIIEKWLDVEYKLLTDIDSSILRQIEDSIYLWDIDVVINELKELAVARYINLVCKNGYQQSFNTNAYELKEKIIKELDEIKWEKKENTITDFAMEYLSQLDSPSRVISSGFYQLDELITLKAGQLITIAGRPWMWKTMMMQNMAIRQSMQNKVLFISLEMTWVELIERFVCMTSWFSIQEINKLQTTTLISEKLSEILEKKLKIKDDIYSLQEIEETIRQHKVNHWLDIVYIDYLGLIRGTKKTIIESLTEITKWLKIIAKKYDINLVIGSQLNREVEKRINKEPQLSDLRDSWSIEQDSDIVIMLHREEYYDKDTENKNNIGIYVKKQRNGRIGDVYINAEFSCFRIW